MPRKTPPKRRGPRRPRPTPELVFEPWTRARQQSVLGGIAAILAFVALSVVIARNSVPEYAVPQPYDTEARRARLSESTEAAREGALAKVSWGVAAGATPVSLGGHAPVEVPVTDGRAVASIGIHAKEGGKRPYVMLTVSVFAGERRLFGNTLYTKDAAGPTDALTISFNAEAVRASGTGAEPLTVRVEGFDAIGHSGDRNHHSGSGSLGEARLVIAPS